MSSDGDMGIFGIVLLVIGILLVFYFLLFFNTSVSAPGMVEGVNNLGLLMDKLIGVICGLAVAISGLGIALWHYGIEALQSAK